VRSALAAPAVYGNDELAVLVRASANRQENPWMQDPSLHGGASRDPLHGLTLEAIVRALEAHYGWAELAVRIPVRCFTHDPTVTSSLKFLRKTPWARAKVESLYLFMLRDLQRGSGAARR
jgi:uncharacterized protein (DUF2132 family)